MQSFTDYLKQLENKSKNLYYRYFSQCTCIFKSKIDERKEIPFN